MSEYQWILQDTYITMNPLFPDCVYPPVGTDIIHNDKLRYECAENLGKISREILRKAFNGESVESSYFDFSSQLAIFGGKSLSKWREMYADFFVELGCFLRVEFEVKRCDAKAITQNDEVVSLGKMISDLGTEHIHASCPFHLEDNVCHCTCAMLRAINNYNDGDLMGMCREGFTGLLHDIAKKNCTIKSSTSISYPAHCIGGSIILRHCWNTGFSKWFTKDQYDMMCDIVCYHMCGCNSQPHEYKIDTITRFPVDVQEGLRRLAIADRGGAIPLVKFSDDSSIAESDELWGNMQSINMTLQEFMAKYEMRGVYISLMGCSAQGKSYTANYIRKRLIELGVDENRIIHVQRDECIMYIGRILLNNPDATYREAYYEIERVNKDNRAKNIPGPTIKQKISDRMINTANKALKKGCIVIYDTCATYYCGARNSIFPSVAMDSLRIDVHVVRTTCVTETDCQRYEMDIKAQIEAAGTFNILEPFSEGVRGRKNHGLRELRSVGAASFNVETNIHGKPPHYALSVSTVTRPGCDLPNKSLDHFISELATVDFSEKIDPLVTKNLVELVNYLDDSARIANSNISREQVAEFINQWFTERAYSVNYPFRIYMRRQAYYLAVLDGDSVVADDLLSKISNIISIAPSEDILRMDRVVVEEKLKRLIEINNNVFTVKYLDGINRQWSAPWNIQARTPICVYCDGKWHVISAMPRGPEVAGDTEHNVGKLQDVDVNDDDDLEHFAPQYQISIKAMNGDKTSAEKISEVVCSSKRDGMCFRCIIIRKNHRLYEFWENAIELVDDPVVTTFINMSKKIIGGIVIPASNGTAFMTFDIVQKWVICSIAMSYGFTHNDIEKMVRSGKTSIDILSEVIEKFIQDIAKIAFTYSDVEMHMWEAIGGPNRMCAFDTDPHSELASSYTADQCGISYLGLSCTESDGSLKWIPHYEIPHNFYEPTYWRFSDILTTLTALKDLGKVFGGDISFDQFFEIHPRANADVERAYMPDPEGFVAYLKTQAFGKVQPVYCKAKTWMYYVLHKIHVENIPSIIRMPQKFGESFPGYKSVRYFFGDVGRIERLIRELKNVVVSQAMIDGVEEKARGAIGRSPDAVKFKIILNSSTDTWPKVCIPIISSHFARLRDIVENDDKEILYNISSTLKKILMKLKCFDAGWESNLASEMNVDTISKTGKMSDIVSELWDLVCNYD